MSGTIKFLNSNTALGNRVAVGVSSIVGPTGPKGDFGGPQGLQGPVGSGGGGGGGAQGPQGLMGVQGLRGSQGYQGIDGANGISGGLTLFLDVINGTYSGSPVSGSLITSPNQTTGTMISSGNQSNSTINIARFISSTGSLPTNIILGGLWDMNLYASSANSYYWFSVAYVDQDGVSNRVNIATGSSLDSTLISTDLAPYSNSLYVPTTSLPTTTKRILIDVFLQTIGTNINTNLYFRNSNLSHVHTSLLSTQTATGPQGSIGPQGLVGATGANGLNGSNGSTGASGVQGVQGPVGIGGGGTGSSQWISSTGGIIYYSSGSVGINKANPTGSLDVVGLVSITGTLNMSGNVNFSTGSNVINSTFQNYKETVNITNVNSTSYIVNCNTGNNFQITLTTGTTLSFINVAPTGTLANVNLFITQDSTGNRLITWPSSVSWGNPGAPVLSTTGGAIDILSLSTFTGGSKWFGFLSGRGF